MNNPNDYSVRLPPTPEIGGLTPVMNDDERPRKDLPGKGRKARRPAPKPPDPASGEAPPPPDTDQRHDVDALA
jgi:hypothetical protein